MSALSIATTAVVTAATIAAMSGAGAVLHPRFRPAGGTDQADRVPAQLAVLALLVWLGGDLTLAGSGFYQASADELVPRIAIGLAVPLVGMITALQLPAIRRRLALPGTPGALAAAQTFRVAGVMFLVLTVTGHLPAQFAVPAGAGDLLIGISAPFVARALWRHPERRRPGVTFNLLGLLDLVVAVAMGVLSAPSLFQVFTGPPSTQPMTVLPLVLIPTFAVPIAVALHIASLRLLRTDLATAPAAPTLSGLSGATGSR
jgi:hypothetical protein